VDAAEPLDVDVQYGDVGAGADGHFGRVRAHDARADDHDFRWSDARDAAHQDAATLVRFFEVLSADLRGQTASDFAHRFEQRQNAVFALHRLVSDGGDLRLAQLPSQLGQRG